MEKWNFGGLGKSEIKQPVCKKSEIRHRVCGPSAETREAYSDDLI